MSISNYLEEKLLNVSFHGDAFTAPTTIYVKLHIGDPGEAGTANAAGETTRKLAAFSAAVNPGGTIDISATLTWTNVSTTETISYVSLWDNVSAGNCLASGALAASKAVVAGDTFQITALTITLD